jgi:cytochrome b subunit of formate dehydrogenase
MGMPDKETLRRAVHYIFTIVTLVFLITGFGITEYRTVEPMTFGILTKALAFQIHTALAYPFVALLALHIYLVLTIRRGKEGKNKGK